MFFILTKQQLQDYWETKFGLNWKANCEICHIPMFPFSVYVIFMKEISSNTKPRIEDVQLICECCSKNYHYQTYANAMRRDVWLAFFGPHYLQACFCCRKNDLKFFDSWHISHFISRAKGGSDELSNLRPACAQCNLTMRCKSMFEFIQINNFEEDLPPLKKMKFEDEEKKELEVINPLRAFVSSQKFSWKEDNFVSLKIIQEMFDKYCRELQTPKTKITHYALFEEFGYIVKSVNVCFSCKKPATKLYCSCQEKTKRVKKVMFKNMFVQ